MQQIAFLTRVMIILILLVSASFVHGGGIGPEGFGRFGRFHDDGLLTINIWPDRMEVPGLTLRFATASVQTSVASIDTTSKVLDLSGGTTDDATSVRYTLLYPGFAATFGTQARLRVSRDTVIVENLTTGDVPVRKGLLLRASSGSMVPIGIAFADGLQPTWELIDLGSTAELVITATDPLGEMRFFTPNGTRTISSSANAATLDALRNTATEWVGRGVPVIADRSVSVDFEAGTVEVTETFTRASGSAIAPVPPVLAFAMASGYPAHAEESLQRSGFPTRYGEFAWVDGSSVTYTLPIPPHEQRGLIRPLERTEEVALLNDLTSRLGASWAVNAVDLGYVGMTPAQMAWPLLNGTKRTQLANAWATYLPFAFRLPPYAPSDPRKTWIRETEPYSGLEYWYTYFITGGPGNAYKLDIEWGNMLPIYGLAKYAHFTGDWAFVSSRWNVVRQITDFTDYADDWAWMTNCNGDMGWSTGTGDPMTAAYVGHVAALRMARVLGDEEASAHYAYRAARVAVPAVARFWYTDWARAQGVIPSNHVVQGFWEKSTFTSTAMNQNTTDPWGPTNPLSGNGCQPEFFEALMLYAPEALQTYETRMLAGYPDLFDPNHVYPFTPIYGGNSVYVTYPHIYARTFLGQSSGELWVYANNTQSNRGTTSWIAPNVLAELLARETPLTLTEWQPLRWREGLMVSPTVVSLSFQAAQATEWDLKARLTSSSPVTRVEIGGTSVPFTVDGDRLTLAAMVSGSFDVLIHFGESTCRLETIVDNETAIAFGTTGSWLASANPPFIGATSLYASSGTPANTATWTPLLDCSGVYDVYAAWVAASNRTVAARYRVHHQGGFTDSIVNQQLAGNQWNLLGQYTLGAGTSSFVTLSDSATRTDRFLSADAVRFVLVGASPHCDAWSIH